MAPCVALLLKVLCDTHRSRQRRHAMDPRMLMAASHSTSPSLHAYLEHCAKFAHVPSAPSLRLPHTAQGMQMASSRPIAPARKAHARCEQGSELTVCSNAFIGAVCRAVRCCAVRCSEVDSACWHVSWTGLQICVHAGLFRARGCQASSQGSRRVAEAAVAARRSAVGAYLARCRG